MKIKNKYRTNPPVYNPFNRFAIPLMLIFSINSYAHGSLDIVSGSDWQASTSDANNANGTSWTQLNYVEDSSWITASAPYPNPITMPNPNLNGTPYPDNGTTNAQLMWYWGGGSYTGVANGADGPNTVYFRDTFDFSSSVLSGGGPVLVWVAADDWMTLYVNGKPIYVDGTPTYDPVTGKQLTPGATYILTDHQNQNDQPIPMLVNIVSADLEAGGLSDAHFL